ncbi:hypothetical protein CBM2599_B120212 [Cupriavidus taiwanensis]|nr:hypothetical protein CBM2599_B120212 [Cupriavidus taiwanensis]SOY98412.1 hypothetical protein CBM2600_B130213 [Cupriavidus taiwanensis]
MADLVHVALLRRARGKFVDLGARPRQALAHALDHQRWRVMAVQAEGGRRRRRQPRQRRVAAGAKRLQALARRAVGRGRFAQHAVGRAAFGGQRVGGVERDAVRRDVVQVLPGRGELAVRGGDHQRRQHHRAQAAHRGRQRQLALQAAARSVAGGQGSAVAGIKLSGALPQGHAVSTRLPVAGPCVKFLSIPTLLTKRPRRLSKSSAIRAGDPGAGRCPEGFHVRAQPNIRG